MTRIEHSKPASPKVNPEAAPKAPDASSGIAGDRLRLSASARGDGVPTAQCNDGAVSYSRDASGTCSHHGGVGSWTGNTGPSSGDRPAPPPVDPNGGYRPAPPAVDPNGGYHPVPPAVYPNGGPMPPPIDPSFTYYLPTVIPIIEPTDPRPLPSIPLPPAPEPAKQISLDQVSTDPLQVLADLGRLHKQGGWWIFTTHPQINADEARQMLNSGQTVYLTADSGIHFSSSSFQPINNASQLQSFLPAARQQDQQKMQNTANDVYQQNVDQWKQADILNRENNLPAFNSIYDMTRLNMNTLMMSAGGQSFNRDILTAMNIYNESGVRQEIAQNWHNNPSMTTTAFNQMANSVIVDKARQLYWDASLASDGTIYLENQPVPGLAIPYAPNDQAAIDWNTRTIQQVANELPFVLNSSVLQN